MLTYFVFEIQNGTVVVPIKSSTNRNEADSMFYLTLSYAAVSTVERHTVILVDNEGRVYKTQSYIHMFDEQEDA